MLKYFDFSLKLFNSEKCRYRKQNFRWEIKKNVVILHPFGEMVELVDTLL